MKFVVTRATMECGQLALLVSIDGESPELMNPGTIKPHFQNPNDKIIVDIPELEERREAA